MVDREGTVRGLVPKATLATVRTLPAGDVQGIRQRSGELIAQFESAGSLSSVKTGDFVRFLTVIQTCLGPSRYPTFCSRVVLEQMYQHPMLAGGWALAAKAGLSPSSMARVAPGLWGVLFHHSGRVTTRQVGGPEKLEFSFEGLPSELLSEAFVELLRCGVHAFTTYSKVSGSVERLPAGPNTIMFRLDWERPPAATG